MNGQLSQRFRLLLFIEKTRSHSEQVCLKSDEA